MAYNWYKIDLWDSKWNHPETLKTLKLKKSTRVYNFSFKLKMLSSHLNEKSLRRELQRNTETSILDSLQSIPQSPWLFYRKALGLYPTSGPSLNRSFQPHDLPFSLSTICTFTYSLYLNLHCFWTPLNINHSSYNRGGGKRQRCSTLCCDS